MSIAFCQPCAMSFAALRAVVLGLSMRSRIARSASLSDWESACSGVVSVWGWAGSVAAADRGAGVLPAGAEPASRAPVRGERLAQGAGWIFMLFAFGCFLFLSPVLGES
ncbi:hypothetical protein [Crenobacter intestini]|uniref:Uncharacterized protein n=1 Tax=Crenobacter intestini TaxID=2563443 RepID=A0A4T0V5Y3_9NEIS|nr:hypothetical protein [Crenobacter intestini]TIC87174.1 hypothetical protein E5K04_01790 [Crenobacter intestini]